MNNLALKIQNCHQGCLPVDECLCRYTAIRHSLNTFDIINCEHKDWFWRMIGHTAVVYRDASTGMLFVYESTSLNKWSGISGVQLTPMRVWLAHYPGKVFVRRVVIDRMVKGKSSWWENNEAQKHIKKYRGVPYPDLKDPKQLQYLANLVIDLPFGIGENPDRHDIFACTPLVVDFWQDAQLYVGEWPPSEWQPDDTRPGGKFEERLAEGVSLGKEIRLK